MIVKASRTGFTFIELIITLLIVGTLAAFAVPRYMSLNQQAEVTVVQGTLEYVRSAILVYRTELMIANPSIDWDATWPSFTALTTLGIVLSSDFPVMYVDTTNETNVVQDATGTPAGDRPIIGGPGAGGWAYAGDTGQFWANSSDLGANNW